MGAIDASPTLGNVLIHGLSSEPTAKGIRDARSANPIGNVASRIASLFDEIRCNREASKEAQDQLARIVMLSVDVQTVDCDILASCLEIAVDRLSQPNPEISIAKKIIDSVEQRLRVLSHPWVGLRRGSSPAAKVVFGMMTILLPLLLFAGLWRRLFDVKADPLDFHIIPVICLVGVLGSFVSIMTRINEFAQLSRTDASVLFLTGFFKPWVGAIFAFFLYVVLRSSGMSVVTEGDAQGFCFVLTAAFLAGFSERFAQDVASRAEKAFGQITFPTNDSTQSSH
jgi:hypothetical protein